MSQSTSWHYPRLAALLEDWCSYLLFQHGQNDVPVNLHDLAKKLGVSSIVHEEMDAWAYLDYSEGAATIVLRKGVPITRERFSLAHEIGHFIINGIRKNSLSECPSRNFRAQVVVAPNNVEEKLADHVASCLLLPSWHIRTYLGDSIDIRRIERAAMAAQASLSAALIRSVSLATQQCVAFLARSTADSSPRLLWKNVSPSVDVKRVQRDLNDSYVLESLIECGEALAPQLSYEWSGCQVISRRTSASTTDYHGIALVK